MSHVDEGTIHAWLDGAFAADDPERVRIEAHLESCAACRAAVETERGLARRASDVLGRVVPDNVTVEPFEKMLAARRGGGGGGAVKAAVPPRPSYRMPLTLAATVVLAVTATWFAREYLPKSAPDSEASFRATLEQDSPAETVGGQRRQDGAPIPATPTVSDAVSSSRNERAAGDDRGVSGRASGAVTAKTAAEQEKPTILPVPPPAAQAAQTPPATTPPVAARLGDTRQRTQEETRRLAESVLARSVTAEKAVVFGDIAAGESAPVDSGGHAVNNTVLSLVDSVSWLPSDMERVAATLGGSAAGIADMTPDSVQQATVRGVPLARFVYRLGDNTVVELVQWPMGAIADELKASADRDRPVPEPSRNIVLDELIIRADRVDFLLRGMVSPDSLASLRKKVKRNP